jgi:hypothetical protein
MADDPFVVLTTENNARLVFDRAQAQRDHRQFFSDLRYRLGST